MFRINLFIFISASTVSTCSFNSNVSSSGEPVSPSTLGNPASLYSTVEKNNKQRKTIHLGEGVSLATATAEKRKKVEDLYAKVRKKRVDLTISTSASEDYSTYQGIHGENIECITPPPSPWASTTPPAPPPIAGRLQAATLSVLLPGNSQHIRRHSADPNLPEVISDNRVFSGSARSSLIVSNTSEDPNYERIYNEENNSGDSCYEKIKDEAVVNGHQTYSSVRPPETIQCESNYPGYESVKDEDEESADPGYECVARSSRENDPGYEPVRVAESFDDSDSNSDYTVVKLDEIREPGYEIVKNLARSRSDAADPGYEKIKKVPRTDSDATDPGYERVKNKVLDTADPGYETVQRSDSDTDPCYEIVCGNNVSSIRFGEESSLVNFYPSVSHNSNSTVLFVSGNSEDASNRNDSQAKGYIRVNESTATFL